MIEALATIAVLHWMVLVTPGANVLVVTTLAAGGERTAALGAACGVTLVAALWSVLAIAGVHAVFASHALLRIALQCAGAAYLVWLAIRLWRAPPAAARIGGVPLRAAAAFRVGVLTNLGNPKSALFFGSVFATALPAQPQPGLVAAAVLLVTANALAWHVLLALLFSRRDVQAVYAARAHGFSRVAALLVGVFGLRLLVLAWRDWRS